MPRALPHLIKPAPTLVFRDTQQRFKLVSLVFRGQSGQTLPGPARHPRSRMCASKRVSVDIPGSRTLRCMSQSVASSNR